MKVTFDKDGYVEMLIKEDKISSSIDLPNSIELEEDNTLDMRYISCYKLGFNGTKLVLDAQKVQKLEEKGLANNLVYKLKKQIDATDFKVLRHIREKALGITTSLTNEEYLQLEAERESIVRKIREVQDGTKLETDVNVIVTEGSIIEEDSTKEEETETKSLKKSTKKTIKTTKIEE